MSSRTLARVFVIAGLVAMIGFILGIAFLLGTNAHLSAAPSAVPSHGVSPAGLGVIRPGFSPNAKESLYRGDLCLAAVLGRTAPQNVPAFDCNGSAMDGFCAAQLSFSDLPSGGCRPAVVFVMTAAGELALPGSNSAQEFSRRSYDHVGADAPVSVRESDTAVLNGSAQAAPGSLSIGRAHA